MFSEERGDERCRRSVMAHMRFLIHPTDHAVSEDWFSVDAKCLCVCECAREYPLAVLYLPITVHMYRES